MHTIRIQAREDGISLDQLVLSPQTYLNTAPGRRTTRQSSRNRTAPEAAEPRSRSCAGRYLQQVGASQAIVVWATRQQGAASVEYRIGTGPVSIAHAASTFRASSATGIPDYYQHEATLTGLSPGTTYQYDLRVAGVDPTPNVVDHLRTAPADGTGTIRVLAFGDSGNGSAGQGQMATRIGAATFDLALHVGDIAYSNGTYQQFDSFFFPYYASVAAAEGHLSDDWQS